MSDILTTSSINYLISTFKSNESKKLIQPVTTRKTRFQNITSAYGNLLTKLNSLKSTLAAFNSENSSAVFNSKTTVVSNPNFFNISASGSASLASFDIRVNQLAKNDLLISNSLTSSSLFGLTGTHSFSIKSGDGNGGEYISKVSVTLDGNETNFQALEKIKNAINSNKASVTSSGKEATASFSGGESVFRINVNGSETLITLDGEGSYEEVIDEAVNKINNSVNGVTAEKIIDDLTGDVKLKISVNNKSQYISIENVSGFDFVSDMNLQANKLIGASGIVSSSNFSPTSDTNQLSITSKQTGVDFRITSISDEPASSLLSQIGLNLGTSRPAFDQQTNASGFLYADISSNSLLNAKMMFNGITVQRNTNIISDLVEGVTITLKAAMQQTDPDVSVQIVNDDSAARAKVDEFIQKFNDVFTFIKASSTFSASARGPLYADSNSGTILRIISSVTGFQHTFNNGSGLLNLNRMGISFNGQTGLTLSDPSKLEELLLSNADDVKNFLNQVSVSLTNEINPYLGADGYLTRGQNSFQDNIKALDDKKVALEKRIEKSADVLRKRYEKLQAQLAALLTTQSMFTGNNYF